MFIQIKPTSSTHATRIVRGYHCKPADSRNKSPRVIGGFLVLVRFRRRRRSANTFKLSGEIPESNFLKQHMVDLWM